jgi:hypothetical protein
LNWDAPDSVTGRAQYGSVVQSAGQSAGQSYTVAAAQARQLRSLVEDWHVPAKELLEEFRLTTDELERPNARLPTSTMVALIERAQALTGEQALGCHSGEQKHVSMYGIVGFAAMGASTLGESMAITARFAPVVSSAFDIRLRVEGNRASMIFDELTDLGAAREVELIDRLVGIPRVANALAGGRVDMEIDFAMPERPLDADDGTRAGGRPELELLAHDAARRPGGHCLVRGRRLHPVYAWQRPRPQIL